MNENNNLNGTAISGLIKTAFFSVVIIVGRFAAYSFAITFMTDLESLEHVNPVAKSQEIYRSWA